MRALVLALALLLLGATPAAAETWQGEDARRDVTAFHSSPEPPPCGTFEQRVDRSDRRHDLTGLLVDHGAEAITLTLGLRSVVRRDHATGYHLHLRTPAARYVVEVHRGAPRQLGQAYLTDEPRFGEPDRCGRSGGVSTVLPCETLTTRSHPATATVEVVLPRACVDDPAWVKVGVEVTGSGYYDLDRGTFSGASDRSDFGPDRGVVPPYGPRVRSSS